VYVDVADEMFEDAAAAQEGMVPRKSAAA